MRWICYNILIVVCALVIVFASCKRAAAPTPPAAADVLVIVVGGLGSDQTQNMADAIRARCSRAMVISAGSWDAYKVDIRPIIAANAKPKLVLILHSYAAWWLTQSLAHLDYLVILDGVNPGGDGQTWYGDLPAPVDAAWVELFWRTDLLGPRDARIAGEMPILVPGGHNDVPHDSGVIDQVVSRIDSL